MVKFKITRLADTRLEIKALKIMARINLYRHAKRA